MAPPTPSPPSRRRVFVAGANGYIGRAVVRELVDRGHDVVSFVRALPTEPNVVAALRGSEIRVGSVRDPSSVREEGTRGEAFDAFVSCLAARSGTAKDAWAVDHGANLNVLQAALDAGAERFVLLSAICLQNPRLAFQQAKLAFEESLRGSGIGWSIVRPTAFFKSLAGQVPRVMAGKPFILFGPGDGPACKPISERDLARFMSDCVDDPAARDRVLPVGGPGPAVTPRERGALLFELTGRKPRFRRLPMLLFDAAALPLRLASVIWPPAREKAELASIGRYYATEPMLLRHPDTGRYDEDATPEFGADTLRDFYRRVIREGMTGQEMGRQGLF